MSMSIGSYSGLSSRKGVGGLASGLDTDSLVEKMTLGTRQKITSQMQKKQVAMWKQEDYRAISNKLMAFKSKYFTYSSPETNIMSSKFFKTSTAKPSNSQYVKFSGDAEAAKNIQIKDIQQLAESANFTSTHKVTNQKMESTGAIYEKWRESQLGGTGISISVGDKKYAIGLPHDFYLNSNETTPDKSVEKILAELNKSIESTADLKGKLEFKLDTATQMVTLQKIPQTAPATDLGDFRINEGNTNLLTVIGLKSSVKKEPDPAKPDEPVVQDLFASIGGVHKVRGEAAFETSRIDQGVIAFEINGKIRRLEIGDFRFSDTAVARDASGNYTADAVKQQLVEIKTALNDALAKAEYDTGEKDAAGKPIKAKLSDILEIIPATGADKDNGIGIAFASKVADKDGKQTIEITGASSQELLNALGFEVPKKDDPAYKPPTASVESTKYDPDKLLLPKELNLGEVLTAGSAETTISFNFNSVSKTIAFPDADKDKFNTPEKFATYLQEKLNKAYGDGNTTVAIDPISKKLSFAAKDSSAVFTIQNSNGSGIMGEHGALHMLVGESNRLELSKTLEQAGNDFKTTLAPNAKGKYELTVNGVDFSFDKDTLVGDVISKINANPDTGVKISYSSVTDTYSVTAKDTGAHTKVDIKDKTDGGNLAAVLFGTQGNDADGYTVKSGQDLKVTMSFDGGKTTSDVVRSTNTINVDGANMEILGKADGTTAENITFSVESNSEELYKKLETFIKDYNEIVGEITKKTTEKRYGVEDPADDDTQYLPLTDEQKKEMSDDDIKAWNERAKMGLLRNDQTMYKVGLHMRTTMSQVKPDGDALYQVGIATAQYAWSDDGKLVIDKDKLTAAITNDPERIVKLFTETDTGIAVKMQKTLEDIIGTSGAEEDQGILIQMAGRDNTIAPDNSNMTQEIKRMTQSLTSLKSRLISEENRYWSQFTQLEKYISQMNQQSSWLTQQNG